MKPPILRDGHPMGRVAIDHFLDLAAECDAWGAYPGLPVVRGKHHVRVTLKECGVVAAVALTGEYGYWGNELPRGDGIPSHLRHPAVVALALATPHDIETGCELWNVSIDVEGIVAIACVMHPPTKRPKRPKREEWNPWRKPHRQPGRHVVVALGNGCGVQMEVRDEWKANAPPLAPGRQWRRAPISPDDVLRGWLICDFSVTAPRAIH